MTVQNHIHLAMTVGSSPEYAPIYKWAVMNPNYIEVPRVIMATRTTLKGKLQKHVLKDDSGVPLDFTDYNLVIKVVAEYGYTLAQRKAQLRAMQGQAVYFVPIDHTDDGSNHTAYVRQMFVAKISEFKPITVFVDRHYVEVELLDDNTVT